MPQIRAPKYTADGRIDCELLHPRLGWVPFTASPSDGEAYGREIYAAALAAVPAAYVPQSPALTQDDYRLAVDAHVETTAQAWGYNSAAHLGTYVASTVPQWAAEARAFIGWRDAVWLAVVSQLTQVQAGQQPPPASTAALIATLPAAARPAS